MANYFSTSCDTFTLNLITRMVTKIRMFCCTEMGLISSTMGGTSVYCHYECHVKCAKQVLQMTAFILSNTINMVNSLTFIGAVEATKRKGHDNDVNIMGQYMNWNVLSLV